MGQIGENIVLKIEAGVAWVDVSTPKVRAITRVDETDLPFILDGCGRWGITQAPGKRPYVTREIRDRAAGQARVERLHRRILGLTERSLQGDHESHDTLDNRRSNLRPATYAQNARNRVSAAGSASQFLGVTWHGGSKKWRARIRSGSKKNISLGLFYNEVDAALAYDRAAETVHGEFASLNFPLQRAA